MAKKEKYGNVYEIKLPDNRHVYVCWIRQFSFGVFDYISEKPTDLSHLLSVGFKIYKACKETAVRKKIWKLIGHIDLEKENIQWPDLANFMPHDKEEFIERSIAMRNGESLELPQEEYLALLKKGYIYGFFDNYQTFEHWISGNIEDYPENQDISPLPI